jgi:hypothetical protein
VLVYHQGFGVPLLEAAKQEALRQAAAKQEAPPQVAALQLEQSVVVRETESGRFQRGLEL